MSNELTLVLDTPIENLIPAMISFNNKELLANVCEILKQYDGITYDDSQVTVAKQDRARLNAFAKALNDERIRISKVYLEPYENFKAKVDEVIGKVKETISQIDGQVKTFETEKQNAKQNEILEYYKVAAGEYLNLVPYEKIHQAKWLNVSVSMKSIKTDIDNVFVNIKNGLVAIEALKSEDEATIKAFYFRTLNLSDALLESERLKQERQKAAEIKQSAEVNTSREEVEDNTPRIKTVKFQVEATVEQLKKLQTFLRENNIKFSAI